MTCVRCMTARVLEADAQRLQRLIVDAEGRLPAQDALGGPRDLEVVGLPGRDVGDVRHRPHLQDVQAGLVEPVRRDPAEHAAIGEAGRLIGRRAGAR